MRASDDDREKIAARLQAAHAEGRLTIEEFQSRIDQLYRAQTYGELEPLVRDLPVPRTHPTPAIVRDDARRQPERRSSRGDKALRAAWALWACAVAVNLVVWFMVSVGNHEFTYFWPAWVAGPWGAILLTLTLFRHRGD